MRVKYDALYDVCNKIRKAGKIYDSFRTVKAPAATVVAAGALHSFCIRFVFDLYAFCIRLQSIFRQSNGVMTCTKLLTMFCARLSSASSAGTSRLSASVRRKSPLIFATVGVSYIHTPHSK